MAPLPVERVTPSPPFTHVGIDFLGPLYIKNAFQEAEKSYVCLFTCCATRAVHLELTRNMTTESCLSNVCRGWCREEARLTCFGLTILNRIKTLTKSSAKAGKLSQAISHRKGSRVVVFAGSSFPLGHPTGGGILWETGEVSEDTLQKDAWKSDVDGRRNEDNTYRSRGSN